MPETCVDYRDKQGNLHDAIWWGKQDMRRNAVSSFIISQTVKNTQNLRLAYAEIYVTLGNFFHKYGGLKVYQTTDDDMEVVGRVKCDDMGLRRPDGRNLSPS